MTIILQLTLLISIVSVGLCDQPTQQQDIQFGKFQGLVPIKVKRTFRSLNPAVGNGNGFMRNYQTYPQSRMAIRNAQRWPYFGNYQLPLYSSSPNRMRSLSPYRRSVPTFPTSDNVGSDETENILQQSASDQIGRLRFLGWLFGRPPIAPYPDYSVLEEAAGISYGSRLPSVGYPRPHTPYVVEECVELLDPHTDHVIEECQEVPVYH